VVCEIETEDGADGDNLLCKADCNRPGDGIITWTGSFVEPSRVQEAARRGVTTPKSLIDGEAITDLL